MKHVRWFLFKHALGTIWCMKFHRKKHWTLQDEMGHQMCLKCVRFYYDREKEIEYYDKQRTNAS